MRLVRLSTLTRNVRTGREVWDYMGRNVKKRSTTSESEWLEKMNKLELMLEHDYSDVVPMHPDWSNEDYGRFLAQKMEEGKEQLKYL